MKKHYAFVPLKDSDLYEFRRALIASLWFRPVFCVLLIVFLIYLGFTRQNVLISSTLCFIVYSFAIAFLIYQAFGETRRIHIISQIKKSSLLPFIHANKGDAFFYSEEVKNGFIIQIEPVNFADIRESTAYLNQLFEVYADNLCPYTYLNDCINSGNEALINKAVIYIEIIKDQLAKGNQAILATYDKLVNYREEIL